MNKARWFELLGDNEDRTITLSRQQRNTLADAGNHIEQIEAENAALRERVQVLKAALEQIADDPRAGHSVRHNARAALAGDGAKEADE